MNTKIVHTANIWLTAMTLTIIARLNPAADPTSTDDDRGDVPGWVMITVMTVISKLGYPTREPSDVYLFRIVTT